MYYRIFLSGNMLLVSTEINPKLNKKIFKFDRERKTWEQNVKSNLFLVLTVKTWCGTVRRGNYEHFPFSNSYQEKNYLTYSDETCNVFRILISTLSVEIFEFVSEIVWKLIAKTSDFGITPFSGYYEWWEFESRKMITTVYCFGVTRIYISY